MEELTLRIDGMHCGACIRRAAHALQTVPGAVVEEVRLGAARVKMPRGTLAARLIDGLRTAGFTAHEE